jgi:hypothetical protein
MDLSHWILGLSTSLTVYLAKPDICTTVLNVEFDSENSGREIIAKISPFQARFRVPHGTFS